MPTTERSRITGRSWICAAACSRAPSCTAAHERAWADLWDDFAMLVVEGSKSGLALHLHTFHVLRTVAGASHDFDAGFGARG